MNIKVFMVVFLGLFYVLGFGILGHALWLAWRSTEAAGWPTAPGTLVKLALQTDPGDADPQTGTSPTYHIDVAYSYAVAGHTYEGSQLALGYTGSANLDSQTAIQRKLEEAASVLVHYNPADPSSAVLSFGLHRSIRCELVFALTWLAVVFGFSLLWLLGTQPDSILLENLTVH